MSALCLILRQVVLRCGQRVQSGACGSAVSCAARVWTRATDKASDRSQHEEERTCRQKGVAASHSYLPALRCQPVLSTFDKPAGGLPADPGIAYDKSIA